MGLFSKIKNIFSKQEEVKEQIEENKIDRISEEEMKKLKRLKNM